jgi:HK97 family phage portal protein
MGFFSGLRNFAKRSMSPENPSTTLSAIAKWLNYGSQTSSGEEINEHLALKISTIQVCVRVLTESVASLPCVLYERTVNGRKEAFSNPLHYLLSTEPNSDMSAFQFIEAIVGASALTGNGYAEIKWRNDGTVGELYPLNPMVTEPVRLPNGLMGFKTRQGCDTNQWRIINGEDCLHFPLFSLDGLKGISPIMEARETLGLARACEKYAAKWFGNGASPGGILTAPEGLDEAARSAAKASWEAANGGSNQGRTAVLPGNWEYTPISVDPTKSQLREIREFLRAEMCALLRIPPHMAGDLSKISNNSYEQLTLSFVNDTLRPILTRIEVEMNRKLMPQTGRKANKLFVRFDLSERLRADSAAIAQVIQVGRQNGVLTVDEARILLGENPLGADIGNSLMLPVNMQSSEKFLAKPEPAAPTPQPKAIAPEGTEAPGSADTDPTEDDENAPLPDEGK